FVAVLPVTMSIDADSPYWLEIVQIGGIDSHFRGEFSRTGETNGQVFNNDLVGDWTHTVAATTDTAYQLIMIPEPGTGLLVLSCAWLFCIRRQRYSTLPTNFKEEVILEQFNSGPYSAVISSAEPIPKPG